MKAVVSHLISIKDWDTDQDRCLQEILDLEKQKTHYTKEIYDRQDKLHEIIHNDHASK